MSSRKGGRWSSPSSASKTSKSPKLSTGSFKGRFSSSYKSEDSTTSSDAGEVTPSSSFVAGASGAAASIAAFNKPMISLTSSTGSSSCLLSSQEEDSTSDHSSKSSSLNRIASRASDIQTYASRYLDSIRSKSWTGSSTFKTRRSSPRTSRSPVRSDSPSSHSGIPYLLTFRQHQQRYSPSSAASILQTPTRPHSVSPSPTPPVTSLSPPRKYSDSRWFRHITEASNAYRARDNNGRRSRYPVDPLNGLEGSGDRGLKSDDHLGLPDSDKKGQPAGRSQSFHEQSTSNREPHPERQPSSPPDDRGDLDSSAKKAGDSENGSNSRKRFQRVEILKIAEPCPLIDPSQVVVTQGEILVADPVLTPIEKIRRKDLEVARALEEKHRLVAEYYQIPVEPCEVTDLTSTSTLTSRERDAREVLLAALVQVKSLSDLVNESLSLSEMDAVAASSRLSNAAPAAASISTEDAGSVPTLSSLASEVIGNELPAARVLRRLQPPTGKLIAITKNMNHHLTNLLEIIQDRDEERERLRRELQRAQEQVHTLMTQSSVRTSSLSVTSPTSRPASYISVEESSGPEMSERNLESEDDASAKPLANEDRDSSGTLTQVHDDKTNITEQQQPSLVCSTEEVTKTSAEEAIGPNDDTVIREDETNVEKTIEDNTEDDSAV